MKKAVAEVEHYSCGVCVPDGENISNGIPKIGWTFSKAMNPTTAKIRRLARIVVRISTLANR